MNTYIHVTACYFTLKPLRNHNATNPSMCFPSVFPNPISQETYLVWKRKGGRKATGNLPLPASLELWRREKSFGILELWLWGYHGGSPICHSIGTKVGSPSYYPRYFIWRTQLMSVDLSFVSGVTSHSWHVMLYSWQNASTCVMLFNWSYHSSR